MDWYSLSEQNDGYKKELGKVYHNFDTCEKV